MDDRRAVDPAAEYQPPTRPRTPWLFEDQIAHNKWGTFWLMLVFVLLLSTIVWAVGHLLDSGPLAMFMALAAAVLTLLMSWGSYYFSDQIVLAMAGATPITKEDYPHLVNTLEGLCIAGGLRTVPKAYVIFDDAPNAFATGRDPEHAAIAVTSGLLARLDRYQLEGVLAHELSHVANRDILLQTIAAVLVGTIVLLADWAMRAMWYGGGRRRDSRGGNNVILLVIAIAAMILAPIVAKLLQLAVSRRREYLADANAIKLTRYPDGLSGALEVIAADSQPLASANKATAHMYIYNPLVDHGGWLNSLFSTHPPVAERIARLRSM